jgi:hypothetical protein
MDLPLQKRRFGMGSLTKTRMQETFPEGGCHNTKKGWQLSVSVASDLIHDGMGNLKSLKVDGKAIDLATMSFHRGGDAQQQKYSALIHMGSPLPAGVHAFEFEIEGASKISIQREIKPAPTPASRARTPPK